MGMILAILIEYDGQSLSSYLSLELTEIRENVVNVTIFPVKIVYDFYNLVRSRLFQRQFVLSFIDYFWNLFREFVSKVKKGVSVIKH